MDDLFQRFLQKDDTEIDLFTWGYDEEGSIDPKGTTHCSANTDCDFKREEDWGSQIGDGKTWRTLTADEWSYLIDKNKKRFAKVTVCGIYGIILFPDNFDGKNVVGGIAGDGTWANWENYKFDEEGWDALQKQGVVFLPNAGCRPNAQIVQKIGNEGYYWSSSSGKEAETAKCLLVNNSYVEIKEEGNASTGRSVRLVTDVSATPTPTEPDYVVITAKYDGEDNPDRPLKWSRQNLAITDSGNKKWRGENDTAVKVPGTNEDVIVGDYFQWAASYGGYNVTENQEPDSLLIYTLFTNTGCGDDKNEFAFIGSKQFNRANAPYGGTSYTKYTSSGEPTLEPSDDVASIILGGTWRMPTSVEFKALKDATYWKWEDGGYYVYDPQSDDAGKINDNGTGTYDKSNALLFFPAAGYGNYTELNYAGTCGGYWSSTFKSSGMTNYAYRMEFNSDDVNPQYEGIRSYGFSIRPVADL